MEDQFLTDKETQICELCYRIAGLWNRRGNLIKEGHFELGMKLDTQIKFLITDLQQWMYKEWNSLT